MSTESWMLAPKAHDKFKATVDSINVEDVLDADGNVIKAAMPLDVRNKIMKDAAIELANDTKVAYDAWKAEQSAKGWVF